MSSGLTIKQSPNKSWIGKRLWLNISAAGFHSLHVGGALRKNEDEDRRSMRNLKVKDVVTLDKSSEEMHQQYLKEVECKSKWVRHMRLKDMIHEHDGVVVVSIPIIIVTICALISYLCTSYVLFSYSHMIMII